MRHGLFSTFRNSRGAIAAACFSAAALVFAGQAGAVIYPTGNLLTNPGYELSSYTTYANVTGSPFVTSVWGIESGTVTGPVGGVTPNGGSFMLAENPTAAVNTRTVQSVDVSAYSTDINTGAVTANLSALFDVDSNVQAAIAGVGLRFFDSSHTLLTPTNIGAPLALDTNPATWQTISLSSIPVPVNTNYLLAEVVYNNASLANTSGVIGSGYVDDAVLTLNRTNTPEPGVMLALIPLGGLLLIRKRRPTA